MSMRNDKLNGEGLLTIERTKGKRTNFDCLSREITVKGEGVTMLE